MMMINTYCELIRYEKRERCDGVLVPWLSIVPVFVPLDDTGLERFDHGNAVFAIVEGKEVLASFYTRATLIKIQESIASFLEREK